MNEQRKSLTDNHSKDILAALKQQQELEEEEENSDVDSQSEKDDNWDLAGKGKEASEEEKEANEEELKGRTKYTKPADHKNASLIEKAVE